MRPFRLLALALPLCLAACASMPEPEPNPVVQAPAASCPPCAACPSCVPDKPDASAPRQAPVQPANWADLRRWAEDDPAQAWAPFLVSCRSLGKQAEWAPVCEAARALGERPSTEAARSFFMNHLQVWRLSQPDGGSEGLITGYYEPLIKGSRTRSKKYATPVLAVPDDLISVDLAEQYPELKGMRLRGRVQGNKLVPYAIRPEIEARAERGETRVLLWAEDPIEFFFLQVQGSGQVQLPDGSRVRIAYADQNGHPYRSIGRWLVDQGELKLEQASMEGIRNWVKANPSKLDTLLAANPSYVFFKEQAASNEGPQGALGVALTAGRSLAVDPRSVPLGAPVFLDTTYPASSKPLARLMLAQDTGGAIRGGVRGDFYWGFGAEAGAQAGKMRSSGRMWLLWPKDALPPGAAKP